MAKVIDSFTIKRPGRTGEQIDWDKLFDGKIHELKENTDFKSKISTFRQKAGKAARDRGGHVETRVDAKAGLIQLRYDKNGSGRKKK